MKKLTDIYIKANKSNVKELNLLIKKLVIEGDNLIFESEYIESVYIDDPKDKQKVSLSQLKRLIETIPTREEITRLKRQISAYKLNAGNYKHEIEMARNTVNQLHSDERIILEVISNLNKDNEQLNKMYDDLVVESGKKQNLLQNLYDDALKEVDKHKDSLIQKEKEYDSFESDLLESMSNIIKENFMLKTHIERLKNKKWYHIWKT